jgi:HSP20 family protein
MTVNMNGLIRWQRPITAVWPDFSQLTDLHNEINRLFGAPLSQLAPSGWTPALDLYEDKDNFYVKAELPGMKKEDVELSLHEGSLSISGERKQETKVEEAEVYRAERFFGRFERIVSLPTPVAVDRVKAEYKDGLLTVTLPKTEEAKPKRIDVQMN